MSDFLDSKETSLDTVAYICELLMFSLKYLSLKESSELLQIIFNVLQIRVISKTELISKSYCFTNLNLQQMFLKLLKSFIEYLPIHHQQTKKKNDQIQSTSSSSSASSTNVNLNVLIETFNNEMKIDDDDDAQSYIKFLSQLHEIIQQLKPKSNDIIGLPLYYQTLSALIISLHSFDKQYAIKRSVSVITQILDGFESNKSRIVQSSMQSIIDILQTIVSKSLINQTLNHSESELQSIIVMIEPLLGHKYRQCWMFVFDLCSKLFQIFQTIGFPLLTNILLEVSELRCLQQPVFVSHLEDVIAQSIRYSGVQVLDVIDLCLPTAQYMKNISMDNAILHAKLWMFPLLKHNINRCSLEYFFVHLLPIAEEMNHLSNIANNQQFIVHSKTFNNISHMIWSLFPSFCIFPSDIDIFVKIAPKIAEYLIKNKEYHKYILQGFINLINKPLIAKSNNLMKQKVEKQLSIVSELCMNFLPILFNIIMDVEHEERALYLRVISMYSSISYLSNENKNEINSDSKSSDICKLFTRTMVKCLEGNNRMSAIFNTEEDVPELILEYDVLLNRECVYYLILNAMMDYIDIQNIQQFWIFLKQQFLNFGIRKYSKNMQNARQKSTLIEKLMYRSLLSILKYKNSFLLKSSSTMLNFIQFLIQNYRRRISVGARFSRLRCIYILMDCLAEYEIEHMDDEQKTETVADDESADVNISDKELNVNFLQLYEKFLLELIYNISETNQKIKNESLKIIELIALRIYDISYEKYEQFLLKLLAVGLLFTNEKLHISTIAIINYLMIKFEMARISQHLMQTLLKSIVFDAGGMSIPVARIALNFLKIVIKEMPTSILENNLSNIITILLKWMSKDTKEYQIENKLRKSISKCIDLLLKRFGYETILKHIPKKFQKLIKYLRKRANYIRNRKLKLKVMRKSLMDEMNEMVDNGSILNKFPIDNNDSESESENTEFQRLQMERKSLKSSLKSKRKSQKSTVNDRIDDKISVRLKMNISENDDILDLTSVHSIVDKLVSEKDVNIMIEKEERMRTLGIISHTCLFLYVLFFLKTLFFILQLS